MACCLEEVDVNPGTKVGIDPALKDGGAINFKSNQNCLLLLG